MMVMEIKDVSITLTRDFLTYSTKNKNLPDKQTQNKNETISLW